MVMKSSADWASRQPDSIAHRKDSYGDVERPSCLRLGQHNPHAIDARCFCSSCVYCSEDGTSCARSHYSGSKFGAGCVLYRYDANRAAKPVRAKRPAEGSYRWLKQQPGRPVDHGVRNRSVASVDIVTGRVIHVWKDVESAADHYGLTASRVIDSCVHFRKSLSGKGIALRFTDEVDPSESLGRKAPVAVIDPAGDVVAIARSNADLANLLGCDLAKINQMRKAKTGYRIRRQKNMGEWGSVLPDDIVISEVLDHRDCETVDLPE